ncbi:BgTH12-02948 [Blumeria graminis f. sp. triticale]|uniref:BgTH12-02948 n=1 Tax=Blumeria graminis f. sp. triticale TaxID=1689686 RepID=A0A9W4D384_BLUGR|nr:BgTH12-02948 [Blumeria graminis f. sp. triticale]
MINPTLRISRSRIAHYIAKQSTPVIAKRSFISSTIPRQVDFVQELYIRELKGCKISPIKANDSEGHVQKFSPPVAPTSPELDDIASELKAYESSSVEVEGQAEVGSSLQEEDWLEEEPEDDEKSKH